MSEYQKDNQELNGNSMDIPQQIDHVIETKDSPTRSILKAITWRMIASATTFLITFIIFSQATDKTVSESLEIASIVGIVDIVAKLFLYYLHERLLANIKWVKYWRRKYWMGRAWKKLYRKMHSEQNSSKP